MSEQSKIYDFISHELIGPKDGDKEFIESVNPSDLYLLGKIHPIEPSDDLPIDDNEKIEGYFQSKPPSFGLSFYIEGGSDFKFAASCAKYLEQKIIDVEVLRSMILRAEDLKPKNLKLVEELNLVLELITNNSLLASDKFTIKRLKEIYILLDKTLYYNACSVRAEFLM